MEFESVDIPFRSGRLTLEQRKGISDLVRHSMATGRAAPFWAYLWPSARALAWAIGEGPELDGLRAIEIGCGPGAGAIAAARRGAREVIASDIEPAARELVDRNANHCDAAVEFRAFDWNAPPADLGRFDRIYAADVLYADGMLRSVLGFVRSHLEPGGEAILSDPNRMAPPGVMGAGRLRGLVIHHMRLRPGTSTVGGIQLYRIERRRSAF